MQLAFGQPRQRQEIMVLDELVTILLFGLGKLHGDFTQKRGK